MRLILPLDFFLMLKRTMSSYCRQTEILEHDVSWMVITTYTPYSKNKGAFLSQALLK